jgi:DNA (cytosine-5)-methyltransferase 1
MNKRYKHIELFAGCGGMSLGLEAAGFDLFMANELSPMAAETFAFNLLGEDLSQLAKDKKKPSNVLWINSKFAAANLKERLRENPFEFAMNKNSDINSKTNLENKLIVGNIDHFLNFLAKNKTVCNGLRKQNLDLLSGGPPCQGFSLAGKRVKDDYKNLLPLSFAKFAGLVQPKVVLLENVKGITAPFETEDGIKHYSWLEVAKAFALKGFFPVCMLLNSKYFGVPQNRPRFILFAFREDVFKKLRLRKNNSELTEAILDNSLLFYNKVHRKRNQLEDINKADLSIYDIETHPTFFDGKLLPKLKTTEEEFLTAIDAIDDIKSTRKSYKFENIKNEYALQLAKIFKANFQRYFEELQNHEPRKHSYKVKARFRLYQALSNLNGIKQDAIQVISGKCEDDEIFQKVFKAFKEESLLIESGETDIFAKPKNLAFFKDYLKQIESKKHSQRAIRSNEPAPAQMTIPDDLCHYSSNELRTLTVREMARFQSFPDWFVFRSKITTGGDQRNFEVPQYTQIGNAVPPLLAYELGKTISKLLKSIE